MSGGPRSGGRRVYGLLVVRNAGDLVRVNVLHHLGLGLERLLVVDNGSDDATAGQLLRLAEELPVDVTFDPGPFRQDELVNGLAAEAVKKGADWVLPIDADEFFVGTSPIADVVTGHDDAGALRIEVVNFVQRRRRRRPSERALLSMDHRPGSTIPHDIARYHVAAGEWSLVEVAWQPKLLVRPGERTWIRSGAHELLEAAGPVRATAELTCLHAPLRARSELAGRIEHAGRLDATGAAPDVGWQSRGIAEAAGAPESLDSLWRANSNHQGRLEVSGEPRPLQPDDRLRAAVAPHLRGPVGARLAALRSPRARPRPPTPRPATADRPLPAGHRERLDRGREAILEAIGDARDATLVAGPGNLGDELIRAGTRRLLADRIGREITLDQLGAAGGELALICGSGALCRPYCEWKPHAIRIAEQRFSRVIVLPSSADPAEDSVREALEATSAIVFAREPETLRLIEGFCDARLAPDGAFYYDYERVLGGAGGGAVSAFRGDAEREPGAELPEDNDDLTVTSRSLAEWLHRIAIADEVSTDRAHVMIAAAMLGKSVRYRASSYHKLEAIAAWSLAGFPVARIEHAASDPVPSPPPATTASEETSPGAIVVTRDRPASALAAAGSATSQGADTLVVDANSDPWNRARLAAGLGPRARLAALDRDPGSGRALATALERVRFDPVLLLDDDVVLDPGALDELQRLLEADPDAACVTATILDAAGGIEHTGGSMTVDGELASLVRIGWHTPPGPGLTASGKCDWAPDGAVLIRRRALEEAPPAPLRSLTDRERALAMADAGHRILRSGRAIGRRGHRAAAEHELAFAERMRRLRLCEDLAAIRDRHGVIVDEVFELVPALERDRVAARHLLADLGERGAHAVLADWDGGRLDYAAGLA